MPITIRPLLARDRESWNPLWQAYLTFYKSELTDEITEFTWQRLIADSEEIMGFVALDEAGNLIGFAHYFYHQTTWSMSEYCYLEDLYINPTTRGGGAGEILVNAVKEKAKSAGKTQFYWTTQNENFRARGLYNKLAGSSTTVKYEIDL